MLNTTLRQIRTLIRWFLSAPVADLPPAFGDRTPAELRVFEAEAASMAEREQEVVRHRGQPHVQTKVRQENVPVERM